MASLVSHKVAIACAEVEVHRTYETEFAEERIVMGNRSIRGYDVRLRWLAIFSSFTALKCPIFLDKLAVLPGSLLPSFFEAFHSSTLLTMHVGSSAR